MGGRFPNLPELTNGQLCIVNYELCIPKKDTQSKNEMMNPDAN